MIGISSALLKCLKASRDFEVNHVLRTKPGFHELDIEAFIQKLKRLVPHSHLRNNTASRGGAARPPFLRARCGRADGFRRAERKGELRCQGFGGGRRPRLCDGFGGRSPPSDAVSSSVGKRFRHRHAASLCPRCVARNVPCRPGNLEPHSGRRYAPIFFLAWLGLPPFSWLSNSSRAPSTSLPCQRIWTNSRLSLPISVLPRLPPSAVRSPQCIRSRATSPSLKPSSASFFPRPSSAPSWPWPCSPAANPEPAGMRHHLKERKPALQ